MSSKAKSPLLLFALVAIMLTISACSKITDSATPTIVAIPSTEAGRPSDITEEKAKELAMDYLKENRLTEAVKLESVRAVEDEKHWLVWFERVAIMFPSHILVQIDKKTREISLAPLR